MSRAARADDQLYRSRRDGAGADSPRADLVTLRIGETTGGAAYTFRLSSAEVDLSYEPVDQRLSMRVLRGSVTVVSSFGAWGGSVGERLTFVRGRRQG